jgi:hypothetical protein
MLMAQVIVPARALTALVGEEKNILGAKDGLKASVRRLALVNRADGVYLLKDCYLGLMDGKDTSSRLFVDHQHNQSFGLGENLFAWGNIALVGDTTKLKGLVGSGAELHQGRCCSCLMDGKRLSCSKWEEEAKKSGTELSCAVPTSFFKPATSSYGTFSFKGPINSKGQSPKKPGLASFSVQAGGKKYALSYSSTATRYAFSSGSWKGKDIIEISSLGGVQTVSKSRVRYNMMLTRVTVDLLSKLKSDGVHRSPPGASLGFFAFLLDVEQVDVDTDRLSKACPVAISGSPPGGIYVCHESNKTFSTAEKLELAGNLTLSVDPKQIKTSLGTSSCFCYRNNTAISCGSFPTK